MEGLINFQEITRFFDVLGKCANATRFRAFPHKYTPATKKKGRARKFGFCQTDLVDAQKAGLGIYVVINKGGDKKESINQCIAYFAEFDGIPEDDQLAEVKTSGLPKPSMLVRTGGGSLHFYWVLSEPVNDKAQWQADMKRLAAHLGSDPSINDPSRVMRLPGCWYMDREGQPVAQVQIIDQSDKRFTRDQIVSCLPELEPPPLLSKPRELKAITTSQPVEERALELLQRIPARIPGSNTRENYFRLFWGLVAICGANRASQLMAQHSPQWASQEDLQKLAADANGQIGAGTFFEIAKREWGITSPKSQDGYVAAYPTEIQQAETIDDLLGPVEEGKLRRPRTDMLTKYWGWSFPSASISSRKGSKMKAGRLMGIFSALSTSRWLNAFRLTSAKSVPLTLPSSWPVVMHSIQSATTSPTSPLSWNRINGMSLHLKSLATPRPLHRLICVGN